DELRAVQAVRSRQRDRQSDVVRIADIANDVRCIHLDEADRIIGVVMVGVGYLERGFDTRLTCRIAIRAIQYERELIGDIARTIGAKSAGDIEQRTKLTSTLTFANARLCLTERSTERLDQRIVDDRIRGGDVVVGGVAVAARIGRANSFVE